MTETRAERAGTVRLMESALRQLTVLLIPVILVIVVFAPEILRFWLGPLYEREASSALRLLALGVFVNALAHVPSVFLYAVGRPDLPAKLHVMEVLIHLPLTVLLVTRFGITGAALAWALRAVVDGTVLAYFARRLGALHLGPDGRRHWLAAAGTVCGLGAAIILAWIMVIRAPWTALFILMASAVAYGVAAWRTALAREEREAWLGFLPGVRRL